MAFDLSTARPVEEKPKKKGGFDLSTARPVEQEVAAVEVEEARSEGADGPLDIMGSVAEGVGETALAFGSGAVGEIAGGVTGLGTLALTGDPAAAEAVRSGVSDRISYEPRTESGQRLTQDIATSAPVEAVAGAAESLERGAGEAAYSATESPATAALASAVPAAAAQYLGVKIPGVRGSGAIPRAASEGLRRRAQGAERQRADLEAEPAPARSERPTEEGVIEVAEELSEKRPNIPEIAEFDPAIVKAAQELGFEEIPPSVAAGNSQFRAISQGLASITGSKAEAQYGEFLEGLANKADEIIEEGGGSLDKPAVSARFRDESNRTIETLSKEENRFYKDIKEAVNPSQRVEAGPLREFVDSKIEEFGGRADLPREVRQLHNLVYQKRGDTWVRKDPTYASFDLKRRELGQALGKKSGPFADTESHMLKEMYGATKDTQRSIVERAGVGELQDAADALTIKRKAVEDSMVEALGRDLSKDLMPQMATKIRGLPKGNVTKFNEFIEGVPQKMRKEVVVSALNDLIRGTGADQKGLGAAKFVGFMRDLNRSPTAKKALYSNLPKATQRSLNNLYKVANGVYKANQDTIKTGKISQFFPDNEKWLSRAMGVARGMAAMKAGPVGSVAVDSVAEFLANTTPKARKANEFIASPQFQEVIKSATRDGVSEGRPMSKKTRKMEELAQKSAKYRRWADSLEGNAAAQLATSGLVGYLFAPSQKEDQ